MIFLKIILCEMILFTVQKGSAIQWEGIFTLREEDKKTDQTRQWAFGFPSHIIIVLSIQSYIGVQPSG